MKPKLVMKYLAQNQGNQMSVYEVHKEGKRKIVLTHECIEDALLYGNN